MTAFQLHANDVCGLDPESSQHWRDEHSGYTIVIAHPTTEPELWRDYVGGAQLNYRKHGVERALDMDALRDGDDTLLFLAALDDVGRVVGGVRAKGPYTAAHQCHALEEWDGQNGYEAVQKMVDDRIPFGVAEMKTAWNGDTTERASALTDVIARSPLHVMATADVQFVVATAAAYVLTRWTKSGGVIASRIPATPYPDERYLTKMMWWDRRTFASHADPKLLSAYFSERGKLRDWRSGDRATTEAGDFELAR